MTQHTTKLSVGESSVGPLFHISSAYVANATHASLVSTEEELNQRAVFQLRGAGEAATQVPTQVLVERSIEELCMALRTSGASTRAYGVAKVRSFGRPVLVGEPVALLTTVGFRGRGQDDAIFATMFVEVRRGNGTTALKFEVGVELSLIHI